MKKSKVMRWAFAGALALAACVAFAGCASLAQDGASNEGSAGSSAEGASASATVVRIGTMPTEDILPMWIAEQDGLFADAGVEAEVVTFDSAPALSAAITAGEVDMAMTDIMRAVKLCESGAPVEMDWVTLGETADQGRFGVLAAADAPYSTLQEMAVYAASGEAPEGFGVGVAANTVPEYVFDKLCEEAGLEPDAISAVEVASLPERFSLAASGNLGAAALPASLLELGEASGMKLLADDTQGGNISQSVMVTRTEFADEHPEEVKAVAAAWGAAVTLCATTPDAYRALLVEKANINEAVADVYPISAYPAATTADDEYAHPTDAMVEPVLAWMQENGYGGEGVTYDSATGRFTIA